ncbi:peptidylprolyl isomerase [Actinomadura rubrobrunea]|uniref:peptidylprolyl isomerase n=1 Tax=Actinomadura rubrobrunea TaxID=115335 RepID=A0A9W6UVT6_9ACTN|nr:FKBP-type peptidyl-prolyl cis-trans isomerase [Actinomadura rubrobrunea]GLW65434.1 peptidylprolyl isomerase [Actinomadura rubrobrunea]
MPEDDKPRGEPAVKAKLPSAKNIRSPEFTPHGISGGRGRSPRPSALTAAQARRRRRLSIAATVVAVLALAGATTWYVTRPGPQIEVTGAFGQAPKVTIPKSLLPDGKLKVTAKIKGTGRKIANGDTALVKFVFYQWSKGTDDKATESTSKEIRSSYELPAGEQVVPMQIGKTDVKGLDKGLVGQTAGSRVVLQVPPKEGFGQSAAPMGIGEDDSLVFVVDILAVYPKNAEAQGTPKPQKDEDLPSVGAMEAGKGPKITIPKADPPKDMQVKTIIEGNGPKTTKDDTALVNYKGVIWRDGKEFDNSWSKGSPAMFKLDTTEGMKGFFKGLQGQKVGSRVMLVLPPDEGYGKDGNPQAGIKGDDTTVFVVDILGTVPK